MIIDERLADYVRREWGALVDDTARRCIGADQVQAQQIVLSALARVALRWPLVTGKDDPHVAVQRALTRACVTHNKRRRLEPPEDFQLMDVGFVDRPPGAPPDEPSPPAPGIVDPVAVLTRRIRRGRRRRVIATSVVATAAVAAALALTLGGTGAGRPHRPVLRPVAAAAPIALPHSPAAITSGVATGGGYLWTLEQHPSSQRRGSTIVRRDLQTGRPEASYRVAGEDFGIGYGVGRVWVWGVDDFRRHASEVVSLNPTTATVQALQVAHAVAITGAAFSDGYGWFTEPDRNRVLKVAPGPGGTTATMEVPGARDIASASATSVLVSGTFGFTYELPANRLVEPRAMLLTLLSSTPSYGIWIGHDTLLAYQSSLTAPSSVRLQLPLAAGLVNGDPAHGVYVATRSNNPQHYSPYLIYYSPAALKASRPRPTVRLDGHVRVESMVAGQNGGIVFVTSDGAIESWNPSSVG